jgi:predicted nuclease of restriction endonuclease-like RecB superfamily
MPDARKTKSTPSKGSTHWTRRSAVQHGFRSGLEATISSQLDKLQPELGFTYGFESEKLEYIKPVTSHKYTPDFIIETKSGRKIYVESKGRFMPDDRKKHLLIKAQHPDKDIRFVFTRSKAPISKGAKTTCAMWCEKHGFQYADKLIPPEWLAE